MLFSFLIASASTINITNRCIDGAVDHEFLVTLKPAAANSNGRRLDTTEDKLSFLQGWVEQYTVDQHDPEGTTRRKLEANSAHVSASTHILHFFTETQFAVDVRASDEVRRAHGTRPSRDRPPLPRVAFVPHLTYGPLNTRARIRPSRAWPRTRPLTRLRLTASNAWTCRCPLRRTWTRPWPAG